MGIVIELNPAVAAVVGRLAAAYRPLRMILFGSRARGEAGPDSDIDLLIIKETAEPYLVRQDSVRIAVQGSHPRIPFDPIVLTPAELQSRLDAGDLFLAAILRDGKLVYG